jgi:hypothetical protein
MQKQHLSIVLKAFIALNFLFFTACRNEVGVSDVDNKCVVGPNNLTGNVSETTDDKGVYNIFWTSVLNTSGYEVKVFNESDNMRLIGSSITQNLENTPVVPYTCDSIVQSVRPILRSGTLCLPQGATKRLSRPRGGITAIILERTTGSLCSPPAGSVTMKYFNDSSFIVGRTPIFSSFTGGAQNIQNTFRNKILGNVDSSGYLRIVRKNCITGAIINTRREFVSLGQTNGGDLGGLRTAIIGAAGRAGVANPTTNTNVFLDSIRFEK